MPFCNKCGNSLTNEDAFCPSCGEPVTIKNGSGNYSQNTGIDSEQGTVRGSGGNYGHKNLDDLEPGTILDGKYRIEEKLGKGGFGTVYKAWYAHLESWRAIKVISNEFYDDKEVISDLKREAKKLDKINDTHIVRLYDVHLDGTLKYFDMEYVDGGDLVDLKLSYPEKQVPEEKVWDIARQFSQGMLAIHKQHIIHKDIKPQNVMLSKDGVIKIMDFGVAEQFRSSRSRIKDASRAGTPVYMSPEHLLGEDVGTESDIWSFGIMLYELLAGKLLYSGQSQTDVLMQIKERKFKLLPDVSSKMNDLLEKCLQYDFKNRFRNFEEILEFINNKDVPKMQRKSKTRIPVKTSKIGKAETKKEKKLNLRPLIIAFISVVVIMFGIYFLPKSQEKNIPELPIVASSEEYSYENGDDMETTSFESQQHEEEIPAEEAIDPEILAQYTSLLSKADEEFSQKNYQDAMENYNAVLSYATDEQKAKVQEKIDECEKLIAYWKSPEGKAKKRLLGDHLFGSFFIGSDDHFGKAVVTEVDGNLHLEAIHTSLDKTAQVKISGTIKIITDRKFELTGTIQSKNSEEEPQHCNSSGTFTFLASGTRVYWRMQNDDCYRYIGDTDIYFNSKGTREEE